jgi:ribonuclease HI
MWKSALGRCLMAQCALAGIGYLIVCPGGVMQEVSMHLEEKHTNNQAEYRALAAGLEALIDMRGKNVEAYGDSQLMV